LIDGISPREADQANDVGSGPGEPWLAAPHRIRGGSVYLTLNFISNYVWTPARKEWIIYTDFTLIVPTDERAFARCAWEGDQKATGLAGIVEKQKSNITTVRDLVCFVSEQVSFLTQI
jgi:hypothetical protein